MTIDAETVKEVNRLAKRHDDLRSLPNNPCHERYEHLVGWACLKWLLNEAVVLKLLHTHQIGWCDLILSGSGVNGESIPIRTREGGDLEALISACHIILDQREQPI